jgi:hypothetical protein
MVRGTEMSFSFHSILFEIKTGKTNVSCARCVRLYRFDLLCSIVYRLWLVAQLALLNML